jgi:hypothetical protein
MRIITIALLLLVPLALAGAQTPPVLVDDHEPTTHIAGPGAPTAIVGLKRYGHEIGLDTGAQHYGLLYTCAFDDKRPGVAVIGEGYIGMPQPTGANWYHGGFFDLQINGQTIGTTPIHSLTGRAADGRGTVDFVFDTAMAVVRIRFVGLGGNDALYCQALLEPKQEIKSLRVVLRCYPSAFVSNADRHVLTPTRDLAQGDKAELDLAKEWWLLYYDRIYDAGYVSPSHTGVGGCAALWPGNQTDKVGFTVGGYGTDTVMDLKPQLRDFRFVFIDYKGTKNEAAAANLRGRADGLLQQLATFPFADPSVARFPLADKQQEIQKVLATMPQEKEAAASYARWSTELATQLKLVQDSAVGAIMAEANAAQTIQQWEKGLPELRLKALLSEI